MESNKKFLAMPNPYPLTQEQIDSIRSEAQKVIKRFENKEFGLLSETERKELLIAKAKDIVAYNVPDYFREYKKPEVEEYCVRYEDGIPVFLVRFFHNPEEEEIDDACISFRKDSGEPFEMRIGSWGCSLESLSDDRPRPIYKYYRFLPGSFH